MCDFWFALMFFFEKSKSQGVGICGYMEPIVQSLCNNAKPCETSKQFLGAGAFEVSHITCVF